MKVLKKIVIKVDRLVTRLRLPYKLWRLLMVNTGITDYASLWSWQFYVANLESGKTKYSFGSDDGGGMSALEHFETMVGHTAIDEKFPVEIAEIRRVLTKYDK